MSSLLPCNNKFIITYYYHVIMNLLLHVILYYYHVIMNSLLLVIAYYCRCPWPSTATARRAEIFSIIAQYCFSDKDLEYIDKVPENIRDLWYISFANSQNVMVRSKLLHNTKAYFRWYFP